MSPFKVVLLGEGRVGKTSVVLRFCRGTFTEGQPPTIQASCLERSLRLGDRTINLVIWDTAGQERFHALGPIYYRDADAALLAFDITDMDSFWRMQGWVRELRKMVGSEIILTIAGNKLDLERQRVVSKQEAQEYAESCSATYHEISAKLGTGVDEMFGTMGKRLLQRRSAAPGAGAGSSGPMRSPMVLIDEAPTSGGGGGGRGCC